MTVKELRAAIAGLPDDANVVVLYEAGCCESDELAVSVDGGRVIIDAG